METRNPKDYGSPAMWVHVTADGQWGAGQSEVIADAGRAVVMLTVMAMALEKLAADVGRQIEATKAKAAMGPYQKLMVKLQELEQRAQGKAIAETGGPVQLHGRAPTDLPPTLQ